MLVLAREPGLSVLLNGPEGGCLVTVLQIRNRDVSLLISHSPTAGALDSWTVTLQPDNGVKVGSTAEIMLVDVHQHARLGIVASKQTKVFRLEVYEAFRQDNRRDSGGDTEEGSAGSPVPRPDDRKPPSLDARLNEPPPADEDLE